MHAEAILGETLAALGQMGLSSGALSSLVTLVVGGVVLCQVLRAIAGLVQVMHSVGSRRVSGGDTQHHCHRCMRSQTSLEKSDIDVNGDDC